MPRYPGVSASSVGSLPYGFFDLGDNNATVYYSIPTNAALNLGSGAWAWLCWTKVEENSGSAFQYLLSSGVQPSTPSFALYLGEASASIAGEQNRFVARIVDNAGVNTGALVSSIVTGADGIERLVVVQSTGTTVEMWLCEKNGTATRVVNAAVDLGALTAPTAWNLGRRSDGPSDRYWEEWLGGLGKADIALSQTQIQNIASGTSPVALLGSNLAEFWAFKSGLSATETGVVAGIVATKTTASGATPPSLGTLLTAINSSTIQATQSGSVSVTSGVRYLVVIQYIRSGSGTPTYTVTLDGVTVSLIHNTNPPNNDSGIWFGQITPGSSGSQSLSFGSGGVSSACCVAALIPLTGAGTLGTPVTGYDTQTSYAAGFATSADASLILGILNPISGTITGHTPDATSPTIEILDVSTGASTSADQRSFIGYVETTTAGSYTWGSSWGQSREFARLAVEIPPA